MLMRIALSAPLVMAISACGLQQAPDVYAVDAGSAFSALNKSSLAVEAFGRANSQSIRMSGNKIIWRTKAYDSIDCTITMDEVEPQQTKVGVNCGSGPEQSRPMVSMTANAAQQEVIEMVDATLTGRAFDRNRKGQTASRWPDNQGDLSPKVAGKGPPPRVAENDVPPGWYD